MNDELRDELDELLLDHQEQEQGLTESQRDRLNEILRADPEARRQFSQTQLLDAALHLQQSSGLSDDVVPFPPQKPRAAPRPYAWIGAAAAVVFLLGLGLGSLIDGAANSVAAGNADEPTDDGVAFLTLALDVEWTGDRQPVVGEPLSPGRLQFSGGLVQLEFYSGAQLIVEGPADLDLVTSNEAVCHRGKLRAKVPEIARGFTVHSRHFELVDLGTEFGMDVSEGGTSEVQVFDGEVELYPPDGKRAPDRRQSLPGGSGLTWAASDETGSITPQPGKFLSFEDLEKRSLDEVQGRLKRWQRWSQSLANDPRVAVHFDFEGEGNRLLDQADAKAHGTVVGGERTNGRWPGKGALEFKRPGDRVRIDVPGEFDQLTLSVWLRMDAQTGRAQSLILTDGYEVGHAHWQINDRGILRLGVRLPGKDGGKPNGSGYGTTPTFGPRRVGSWTFVCTVYNREAGEVSHFLNGRKIAREPMVFDQAVRIGQGDIGNWSAPLAKEKRGQPVRNFVGRMDELTIWKTALTDKEILSIYRETRP